MQIERPCDLGLRQSQIIVHLEHRPLLLFQAADLAVELGPLCEARSIVGLRSRLVSSRVLRVAARQERLALIDSPLTISHVEQHLPKLMGREPKKIGHRRRVRFLHCLHQAEPRFVNDTIDIVPGLEAGKRPRKDFARQSPQARAYLL